MLQQLVDTIYQQQRAAGQLNVGQNVRQLLRKMQQLPLNVGGVTQSSLVADPQNQFAAYNNSLNNTSRIVFGQITDSTAIANCYRVQFENLHVPMLAIKGTNATCSIMGMKDLSTLQVGTLVICVISPNLSFATIIGAIPVPNTTPELQMASILLGSTRSRVDQAHRFPMDTNNNGGVIDFLAGRPFDLTHVGEQGWISETGMRNFTDPFMALFGLDEFTQIAAFYHDQLLRISGYNMRIWSAAREHESLMDEYENQDWTGYATYPWEQLGQVVYKVDPSRSFDAATWQFKEPWYNTVEPTDDWAMPIHREREFHGYLGQGFHRHVNALPTEGNATSFTGGANTTAPTYTGQFDTFVTLDGRVCTQSAKGIHLSKRAAIVSPSRKSLPDNADTTTDNTGNYQFSGVMGGGPAPAITGDIKTNTDPKFNRALGLLDMHSYFFNYAGLHPFIYHAGDYFVPEESALTYAGATEAVPPFSTLGSSMYLDTEQFKVSWKIDHRYNSQNFYTLACGVDLLDDGGVMIYGGCGETIQMTGGSIFISAPGDIWLKSGRNTNVWAGYDIINRAKNSVDISATNADVRVKAENNMQLLAGNSGTGGMLIEGRGAAEYNFDTQGEQVLSGGVMIRSMAAPAVTWAQQVYLRTTDEIVLDANKGQSDIVTYSNQTQNYTTGEYWTFGISGNNPKTAFVTETQTGLLGQTLINEDIICNGSILLSGSVQAQGAIQAVGAPFVIKLDANSEYKVREAMSNVETTLLHNQPEQSNTEFDQVFTAGLYESNSPGNDDLINQATFGYRSTQDYNTKQFKLYEDRWQQLGRITGNTTTTWTENPVDCPQGTTYPYPGETNYTDSVLYTQDLNIFDPTTGQSKDRGSADSLNSYYATPTFATPNAVSLNQYLVVR